MLVVDGLLRLAVRLDLSLQRRDQLDDTLNLKEKGDIGPNHVCILPQEQYAECLGLDPKSSATTGEYEAMLRQHRLRSAATHLEVFQKH